MNSPVPLSDLAPTGKLRIGIMYTNPILVSGSPGNLRGIVVDLAQELARRTGIPLEIVPYETSAARWGALQKGEWDVTFSACDVTRDGVEFTAPYLESEGTYLVPSESSIRNIEDVDRVGIRIAVSAHSSLDTHLNGILKHARLERIPGAPAAAELLIAGKADVLAGLRQQLMKVQLRLPGSRLIDGRFMAIQQALAIPAGRKAGAQYLRDFVEDIKKSGLAAQTIESSGIRGVAVPT